MEGFRKCVVQIVHLERFRNFLRKLEQTLGKYSDVQTVSTAITAV